MCHQVQLETDPLKYCDGASPPVRNESVNSFRPERTDDASTLQGPGDGVAVTLDNMKSMTSRDRGERDLASSQCVFAQAYRQLRETEPKRLRTVWDGERIFQVPCLFCMRLRAQLFRLLFWRYAVFNSCKYTLFMLVMARTPCFRKQYLFDISCGKCAHVLY